MIYGEILGIYENHKTLSGKAWEHAVALDLLNNSNIDDCSIHCFHYQQMFECLFKSILENKSKFGSYSKTHKLNNLLEEVIALTEFKIDKSKYRSDLLVITVCAEEYRYNFDIDCKGYQESVNICDELLRILVDFNNA